MSPVIRRPLDKASAYPIWPNMARTRPSVLLVFLFVFDHRADSAVSIVLSRVTTGQISKLFAYLVPFKYLEQ